MRHILYFALFAALKSLGEAGVEPGGFLVNDTSPEVLGGAAHECYRNCTANDTRICNYQFTLSGWLTMSKQCANCPYTAADCHNRGCITAGGDVRSINVANHMLPGPSVQVCYGDIIRVTLTNMLSTSEGTTIHWHGMGQIDTPYMDGVPFVTQCPILPGNKFVYNFTADPAGTHIWHAHAGVQDGDGFYGPLVVREPNDVNAGYYDYDLAEHVMIVWHWHNVTTGTIIAEGKYQGKAPATYSFTINGYAATKGYTQGNKTYYTPRANFTVTKGYRYRFRVIDNSAVYCPVQISVDNHTLTMIASDGAPFKPREVDSFAINAGERYDFVLEANQTVGNYWIRFKGLGMCAPSAIFGNAILRYEGADDSDPSGTINYANSGRSGVLMNPVSESNENYSSNSLIRISELENTMPEVEDVSGKPDYEFYIPIALNRYPNFQITADIAQLNNISYKPAPIPLLTQYKQITKDMYCTQNDVRSKTCSDGYCTCAMIYEVRKDSLVEIFLIDTSVNRTNDHPIHFHGNYLNIVALQPGNASTMTVATAKALDAEGSVVRNFVNPPSKDVIGVPSRGFVVLRFIADNPGFWLVHCHVGSHFEEGMGAVLKVGDYSEMVHPPEGFPTCSGDYDITSQ